MFKELSIALTENIPSHKPEAGDVGTIVPVHENGKAYEVEFVANNGDTIAVFTLRPDQIRDTTGQQEIMHVRELTV